MAKALYVLWYAEKAPAFLRRPAASGRVDAVDQYRLRDTAIGDYAALLVSMHLDQRHFAGLAPLLAAYLGEGGTVVFNGHLAYPWLPALRPFVPVVQDGLDALRVHRLADHPVLDGVAEDDLTFRQGVAGFYGRGHNPPPPGALPLTGVGRERVPVDWEWRPPGGGRILMHAGSDLWMYDDDPTTAARITPQLIDWCLGDAP